MTQKAKYRNRLPIWVWSIAILLVLINAFPIFSAFDIYEFSNRDGSFQFGEYPAQGTDLALMEADWKQYKDTAHMDTVLYRTFSMNPCYFWMWGSYLFNKRYRYPYIDPSEIGPKGN